MTFDHGNRPARQRTMQGGAQAQRTGPDHDNIGIHQAIVP
jgi:hypothetical protein